MDSPLMMPHFSSGRQPAVSTPPFTTLMKLEGVRIFAAHSHEHGVNYDLDKFCTSVLSSGSKLVFYGHTHRPLWQEVRGMQIVNPGSVGSAQKPTFALVRLEDGKADCRILDVPQEKES